MPDLPEGQYDLTHHSWSGRGQLAGEAQQGYENWSDNVRRWDGSPAIEETGTTWTYIWVDLNTSAKACYQGDQIAFDTDEFDAWTETPGDEDDFEGIVTHEWGHIFGFSHAGAKDPGAVPTMRTCWGIDESRKARTPAQADEAAIAYITDKVNGEGAFTANNSFEESVGKEYWTNKNLLSWSTQTAGGGVDDSPTYLRLKAKDTTSRAWQRNRWVSDETVDGSNNDLAGRINVRKHLSSDAGFVRLKIQYRELRYQGTPNPDCDGDYPGNVNLNTEPAGYGNWISLPNLDCIPTSATDWNFCTIAPDFDISVIFGVNHGFDLRANIYPRTYKTTIPEQPWQHAHVDRARLLFDD